jgi:hypothetical protein
VRTAYATLGSVFPAVESWQVHRSDLLLMASRQPLVHDLDLVRSRVGVEPYRTAMARIWGVGGLEGFYTSYLATPAFAQAVKKVEGNAINTDDHPILEFGFARNLGRFGLFQLSDLDALVKARGEARPVATRGAPLDWKQVEELRVARGAYWAQVVPDPDPRGDPAARLRVAARNAWSQQHFPLACADWFRQPEPPRNHADYLLVAECLATQGDPRTPQYAALLSSVQPIETDLALADWLANTGRPAEAGERLLAALDAYRRDPWVFRPLVRRTLPLGERLARQVPALAPRIYAAYSHPFATHMFEQQRLMSRLWISRSIDPQKLCVDALAPLEPHVPWDELFLTYRYGCYRAHHHPLEFSAERDLNHFRSDAPPRLAEGLDLQAAGRPGS